MTPFERDLALAFDDVSFLPGSKDKRLARVLTVLAKQVPDEPLTPAMAANLRRLGHKYRRQIPRRLLDERAEGDGAPA